MLCPFRVVRGGRATMLLALLLACAPRRGAAAGGEPDTLVQAAGRPMPGPAQSSAAASRQVIIYPHGWVLGAVLPVDFGVLEGAQYWSSCLVRLDQGFLPWLSRLGLGFSILDGCIPADWSTRGMSYSVVAAHARWLLYGRVKSQVLQPYEAGPIDWWGPYGKQTITWDPSRKFEGQLISPAISAFATIDPLARATRPFGSYVVSEARMPQWTVGLDCSWYWIPGGDEPDFTPLTAGFSAVWIGRQVNLPAGYGRWPSGGLYVGAHGGVGFSVPFLTVKQ